MYLVSDQMPNTFHLFISIYLSKNEDIAWVILMNSFSCVRKEKFPFAAISIRRMLNWVIVILLWNACSNPLTMLEFFKHTRNDKQALESEMTSPSIYPSNVFWIILNNFCWIVWIVSLTIYSKTYFWWKNKPVSIQILHSKPTNFAPTDKMIVFQENYRHKKWSRWISIKFLVK